MLDQGAFPGLAGVPEALIVLAGIGIASCFAGLWIAARRALHGMRFSSPRVRGNAGTASPAATGGDAGNEVTLRSELAEMVRRTNERNDYINSIFSSIDEGILVVDTFGHIMLFNPRARELLGIGLRVFFEAPGDSIPVSRADGTARSTALRLVMDACARVNRFSRPERIEFGIEDGRHLEARINPMTSKYRKHIPGTEISSSSTTKSDQFGALALIKDITEMRRLEGMRKDFVATVSHEFRTPLTLISGFVEMFKSRADLEPDDRVRAFEIMEIETERLKRLISELLTLSEMENALPWQRIEEINPSVVLADIGRSLAEMAGRKGQRLEMAVELEGARLYGNESWFQRAVYNLLENAIKFSPSGTSVRLDARIAEGGDFGRLVLRIDDEGPGIPQEELGRIFERFYRVEKSRGSGSGGSGLGLAIVKDIAGIFGGSVRVDSQLGSGSTFILELPLGPPREAVVPSGSSDGRNPDNIVEEA